MSRHAPPLLITDATTPVGQRLAAAVARTAEPFCLDPPLSDPVPLLTRAGAGSVIFHTGEWIDRGAADPSLAEAANVVYLQDLAAAAAAAGARRLVLLSSIAVYGPIRTLEADESTPLDPDQAWLYGRTRAQGELVLQRALPTLGLDVVTVRAGLVYGPGLRAWTADYLELIQKGTPVLWGAGQGVAPLVYVDNLVRALLLAASTPAATGQAFNLADHHIEWRRYAAWLGRLCGRSPRAISPLVARGLRRLTRAGPEAAELETFYTRRTLFVSRRARQALGYRPVVDMPTGLERTAAWLRQAGFLPARADG